MTIVDIQHLIDLGLAAVTAALAWFAREIWATLKEVKADQSRMREELPKEYVLKDDLEKAIDRIDTKLDKIFDKLDSKADK